MKPLARLRNAARGHRLLGKGVNPAVPINARISWRRAGAALALAFVAVFGVGARAQTAKAPPELPPTLGEALSRVPWGKEQGVLLMLSPEQYLPGVANPYSREPILPDAEADAMQRLLQTPPTDPNAKPVRLSTVARAWKRSVQIFGNVTVVADDRVAVLNQKPGPPDLLNGLGYDDTSRGLLASLTSAQWRLISGKNGIGRSDLQENQVAFFDRLVPDPLTYVTKVNGYYARHAAPSDLPDPSPKTLSPGDRLKIRIHAKLQTDVSAPTRGYGDENSFASILNNGNRNNLVYGEPEKGGAYLALVYPMVAARPRSWLDDQSEFGVQLAHAIRNTPKPSDLDFSAVHGTVSLLPSSTPADASARRKRTLPGLTVLTIADLIPRLQKATGLELYADARLQDREIGIRGANSVAAGSLLQALCVLVGGTLRKVEAPDQTPAYVLTSDREGLASRFIDIDAWWARAKMQEAKIATGSLQAIRAESPLSFLAFDENEPVKLSRDQFNRVAASLRDHKSTLLTKPSELTPVQQAYLNRQVAYSDLDKGFELKGDRYKIGASLWLGLVLPTGEEITTNYVASVGDLAPTPEKPQILPITQNTSLWARISDTGDAEAAKKEAVDLVETAARHQMQVLYLQNAHPPVLQAAIERAAKRTYRSGETHLSIWGILQPLRAQLGENVPIDRNARQQTSAEYEESRNAQNKSVAGTAALPKYANWRVLSAPETVAAVQKEATEMARVPGLGGILIQDALPPGYRARIPSTVNYGNGNPRYEGGTGVELGWTNSQRLQFLREKGTDPLDIVPYFVPYAPVQIPYFPNASHGSELADAWANWRAEKAQTFLKTLRKAIETARPGLSVRVCGQVNENFALQTPPISWLVDWPAEVSLNLRLYWTRFMPQPPFGTQAKQAMTTPATIAPRAFLQIPPQNPGAAWARGGQGWDGVVLDFSQLPPDAVDAQLNALRGAAP